MNTNLTNQTNKKICVDSDNSCSNINVMIIYREESYKIVGAARIREISCVLPVASVTLRDAERSKTHECSQ